MICFCLFTAQVYVLFVPGIWIQIHIMVAIMCLWRLQSLSHMFFLCPVLSGCDLEIRFGGGTPDSLLAVVIQALCQVTVNGGTSRARGALNFLLELPSQCPQTGT